MQKLLFFILFGGLSLIFACAVPHHSSPQQDIFYDAYLKRRTTLLKTDSLLYFDKEVVLSKEEKTLNAKLIELQQNMIADYKDNHFFPPARNFYVSKTHIEQTPLYKILKKMPKGGALHLHMAAMGDAQWMIEKSIATPEMYVYWETPKGNFVKGELRAFQKGSEPAGFHQVQGLATANPNFSKELLSLLTFDRDMDRDSVDIWGEFNTIFQRIRGFFTYKKVIADYLTHGLQLLIADNVQHVEFRTPFPTVFYDLQGKRKGNAAEDFVQVLEEAMVRVRKTDPEFTMNIIHINLRFFNKETIWKDMQSTLKLRKKYPQWLRGYDLVAEEDNGHTTLFHAQEFLKLDSLERATGVELPIYLHDGESDWVSVANLYDAVLLGTKRIGHGFNLFRFPNLLEVVKERDICVEVNPLSNQILGYVRDLRIHPASTYLRRGVNCVISSDDPLIFDYQGLTYDFWSIFLAWELDLAALKKLSKNSIEYAAMTEPEKKKALAVWEKRWVKFVNEALVD